jgi:hypothetical protein
MLTLGRTMLILAGLASMPALAADRRQAATAPATRPATWYARIEPFTDPDFLGVTDEPADPMYSYIESLGRNYRPDDREQAFRILLSTTTHAGRRVGAGGNESEQAKAFQTLVRQPDARDLFEDLFRRARTAGKLYALVAFREINARRFDELAAPLTKSDEEVWTQYGCLSQRSPVRRIVDGISDATTFFALTGPEPTPKPLTNPAGRR